MFANYRWFMEIKWVFKTTGGSLVVCISHVNIFFNVKHFIYHLLHIHIIWTHEIFLEMIHTYKDDSFHWHVQRSGSTINTYCVNTTGCISQVTATRTLCGLSKWRDSVCLFAVFYVHFIIDFKRLPVLIATYRDKSINGLQP